MDTESKKQDAKSRSKEYITFVQMFPDVMKELMANFVENKTLTERLKTKAKMKALLEFLEPETTAGDIKKLLAINPTLQEEIVRLLPRRDRRDRTIRLAEPVMENPERELSQCTTGSDI